jgi:hypothetical protein
MILLGGDEPLMLPVCGSFRLPAAVKMQYPRLVEALHVVAVDAETGESVSAPVDDRDPNAGPVVRPKVSQEALASMLVGGHFNLDAFVRLDLPNRPATYRIHIILPAPIPEETLRSNEVTITVKEAE